MGRRPRVELPTEQIIDFCQRHKIVEFSLFGSVLRDDFGPQSDIDVLVSFAPDSGWSLLDLVEMKQELQEILHREVDLVEREGLRNPFRRHEILRNLQVIYAA